MKNDSCDQSGNPHVMLLHDGINTIVQSTRLRVFGLIGYVSSSSSSSQLATAESP